MGMMGVWKDEKKSEEIGARLGGKVQKERIQVRYVCLSAWPASGARHLTSLSRLVAGGGGGGR